MDLPWLQCSCYEHQAVDTVSGESITARPEVMKLGDKVEFWSHSSQCWQKGGRIVAFRDDIQCAEVQHLHDGKVILTCVRCDHLRRPLMLDGSIQLIHAE